MIGEILSVLGFGYSYVGGVHQNKSFEKIFQNQKDLENRIEKLSDNIIYHPSKVEVEDKTKPVQEIIKDLKVIRNILEPLQKITGNKILSTATIPTPLKMKDALGHNPWEVLDNIRPIQYSKPHSNPDMVPVLFEEGSIIYIGWQMKGTLPMLFGCEYNPEDSFNISSLKKIQKVNLNNSESNEIPIIQNSTKVQEKSEDIHFEKNNYINSNAELTFLLGKKVNNDDKTKQKYKDLIEWNNDKTGIYTDKRDNRRYSVVEFDGQIWMTENFAYHLDNKNCWAFKNDPNNVNSYGYLYNWYSLDKVCPQGWRIPMKDDFEKLLMNLGGSKSVIYNTLTNQNEAGFSSKFCGFRNGMGSFYGESEFTYYWTKNSNSRGSVTCLYINANGTIAIANFSNQLGLSVRLIAE